MNKPSGKVQWLRLIDAYDFALHEMVLYLDTHPNDEKALRKRDEFLRQRTDAVRQYEHQYGKYMAQPNDSASGMAWSWIDNPWPWDYTQE